MATTDGVDGNIPVNNNEVTADEAREASDLGDIAWVPRPPTPPAEPEVVREIRERMTLQAASSAASQDPGYVTAGNMVISSGQTLAVDHYGVNGKKEKKKKVGVSVAIAHFAEEKAKQLKSKLEVTKMSLQTNEKLVEESQKKIRVMKSNVTNLEEKYNRLNEKKRSELVSQYRRIITQLKKHPDVDKFSTDIDKRVLITTHPLFVKKPEWEEAREIGRFQIRIDFSQSDIMGGVNILNLTQRFGSYDSPTINNTRPCWGNFSTDLNNEFASQDLYELVIDLIDYIKSPNDSGGYIGLGGDNSKGWEQFFEKAEKQPKNFSFHKYEQLEKGLKTEGVMTTGSNHWGLNTEYRTTIQNMADQMQQYSTITIDPRMSVRPSPVAAINIEDEVYELMREFLEAGFNERSSYYYAGLVTNDMTPRQDIRNIEIRNREGQYIMYVDLSGPPSGRPTTMRIFINRSDLRHRLIEGISTHGSFRFIPRRPRPRQNEVSFHVLDHSPPLQTTNPEDSPDFELRASDRSLVTEL